MTTVDPWLNPGLIEQGQHRAPGRLRRAVSAMQSFASGTRRRALVTGAKALVKTISARFSLAQAAGGATASVGVFWLWGTGVGLLVTGLSVLAVATFLERQR